jgi:hypothetical protein
MKLHVPLARVLLFFGTLLGSVAGPAVAQTSDSSPSAALLDEYAGDYDWVSGVVRVRHVDGRLLVGVGEAEAPYALSPQSDGSFVVGGAAVHVVLTFHRDESGSVSHLEIAEDGRSSTAKRIAVVDVPIRRIEDESRSR